MTSIYPSSTSSSTSSTSSANLLRISGMASGIDTDSVVKSMVSSYQTKIDKADQAKQLLQWKQDAYRDIIKGIKGLQDYFDPLSSKYILGGNSLNINTAASDDSSVVSATVNSSAKAGTYNVQVTQLATQAKIDGSAKDSIISTKNFTDTTNFEGQKLIDKDGNTLLDLSGLSGYTGADLAAQINSKIAAVPSLNGKISASYVKSGNDEYIKFTNSDSNTTVKYADTNKKTTSSETISINSGISSSSKLVSSDLGFTTTGGDISFKLSSSGQDYNVSLKVDSNTTMQNLIDQINSATSGAVTMSIDDTTGKISLQSKSYGSASNITITNLNSSNNIIKQLGISDTLTTFTGTQGKDAIVAITAPGQAQVTTTQSSNQFTLNGVSYNLVGINESGKSSNITVTANADNVVNNIKSFITDYNTIISTINTKLTEKKDSDYQPLTDAQKESMSESQITAWEAKAKVGILRNDDYLSSLMSQIRGIFSSQVYSSYDSKNTSTGKVSLSFGQYGTNSIGIDTSTDVTDGGKLVLKDETKLKNAIQNNFDDFKKLFIGASDSSLSDNEPYIGSDKYMEDGLLKRIDTILRDYVAAPGVGEDGTYTLSGSMNIFANKQYDYSSTGSSGKNTLPDQVYNKTLSISKLKTQMSDAEDRYYKQFTALETALNNLNSQQSQLSSMLGTS
jgi:flagellar hook-associated protein 2